MHFLGSKIEAKLEGKKVKAPNIGSIYSEISQVEQIQTQYSHLFSLKPFRIALKYKVERMSKKRESKEKEKPQIGEDILHVLVSWGKNSNDILIIWLDSVN